MSIDIHLCEAGEVGRVRQFLDRHWSRGHVLAHDVALLDWQHKRSDGRYNFVVATRNHDPDPLGVLGFIPTTKYDPALAEDETVWLALWKVRADASSAGLGLAMLRYLTSLHPGSSIGVVGIGPAEHIGMYRALGFVTGELTQYYMLNDSKTDFRLAKIPARSARITAGAGTVRLTSLNESSFVAAAARVESALTGSTEPRKTATYFKSRFFAHPVYPYDLYLADTPKGPAIIAARMARHDGRSALRIVDFLGAEEVFAGLGAALQGLIRSSDAEYADVWNAGFLPSTFARAGFAAVDPDGEFIIPNYFEPFVQRNGRITFALRAATARRIAIFRADGDQDRPNMIPAHR